jgi:hypothetical protein
MRSPQEEAFVEYYGAMNDEELLRTATNRESLVPVARAMLADELRRRGKEDLVLPAPRPRADAGTWWRPVVSDAISAKKAATYGATAAFFQAGLTAILAVMSMFKPLTKPLDHIQPNAIVDAFMFAFLGFMIRRKVSRTAAVGALVLWVVDLVYGGIQNGIRVGGVLWAAVFLWAFVSSVRGTFAYHTYQERGDTGTSKT